jgi:hypothetical protein
MKMTYVRICCLWLCISAGAWAQKLAISNCSANTAISGHGCALAYDGNSGTDFQGRAAASPTLDLDLGKICGVKRVIITWGANIPSGFQINGKNNVGDVYEPITGIDAVSGPTTTVLLLPWSQEGFVRDTARYLQIEGYGSVTAMDIKEVAIYGRGVYTEDELLVATYPLGNVGPSGPSGNRTLVLPQTFSMSFVNRIVGVNAVVHGDDGMVQNVIRMLGYPLAPGTVVQPGWGSASNGGTVNLSRSGSNWQITVEFGNYFTSSPNYQRTDINRGYVNLYYLSHDPDNLERE